MEFAQQEKLNCGCSYYIYPEMLDLPGALNVYCRCKTHSDLIPKLIYELFHGPLSRWESTPAKLEARK